MTVLLLATLGHAGILWQGAPIQDEPTILQAVDDMGKPIEGETVRVIYRAGLAAAEEVAIGITDSRGEVSWVPERGGTALVVAGKQRERLSIRYAGVPVDTLATWVLMLGVCLAAFGYGMTRRRS